MTSSKPPHGKSYPDIPRLEAALCFIFWIGSYGWAVMQVYYLSMSKDYMRKAVYRRDLELRFDYFTHSSPLKDVTDNEWDLWNHWLWEMIICSYTLHFIIMRICELYNAKYRFHASMLFSFGFCTYFFGIEGLILLLFQTLFCFSVAYFTKSTILVWAAYLTALFSFNSSFVMGFLHTLYDDVYVLIMFVCTASMSNLRYAAFCIEYCWMHNGNTEFQSNSLYVDLTKEDKGKGDSKKLKREKPESSQIESLSQSIMNLLLYQFYFPLLVGGPIMNYNDFAYQSRVRNPIRWSVKFFMYYLLGVLRYGFWHVVINFLLHFVYFCSIHNDLKVMNGVSLLTLCGLGLCYVQFFCMKYMVMYGLPSKVALADNLEVPGASHCVSSKHKFTFMWKYFDKGLHKWLVRYIFLPLGGSQRTNSYLRSTFTSVIVFAFVYFWHGARRKQLVWAALNWFGVFIEKIASDIYKTQWVHDKERKYLSPAGSRRLRALLSTPVFSLLIISNLYFLAGVKAANVYMTRIYTEDFFSTIIIHLVLYLGAQSSMELTRFGM